MVILQLSETFTMLLRVNNAIDFIINTNEIASFKTDEIILNSEIMVSANVFL